jgi:hypothetical protein
MLVQELTPGQKWNLRPSPAEYHFVGLGTAIKL